MTTPSYASQAVRQQALDEAQYERRMTVASGCAVIFGFMAGSWLVATLLIWAARTHAVVSDRFPEWVAASAF